MKKLFAVMVAIFLLAIIACSSKSGDTPASSSSSIVNYAQITAPSTPVVLGAAESDGSESLILVGNKDSSGNPTSINGVGYSSSKNGQFYFVIDSSSGLPISITDSFGNKMIFSNYTATSAQVSIYNNNVLISGPSQVTFNSSTLSQVQSLWSTISGSLSSASPNIKSSSTRSIKSSSTQNLDTFLIQYAGEVVGLASCATYVTTGGLAIPLVLTCGSAIVGAVDLVTGNETLNTISTFSDVTSCGVDLVSMDVQGLMDCPLAITDFLSNNQNPLPVPSGLTLLSSPTQINLSWNASTDSRVIGYNVYRITSAGVYSKLQSTSQTAAIDTNLQSSTQYCYLISDYDSSGSESLHSDSVCITTPSSGSSVATTLTISGQVLLNGTGLSGVTVFLASAFSISTTTDSNGNYTFTGAQNGSYTVTPSMTGYTFNPVNRTANVSGANIIVPNFVATAVSSGTVTEFSAGITAGASPNSITAGPDGNLWFTEELGNRIGRITPTGVVTEFSTGISAGAHPTGITTGSDGNLWFTEYYIIRIGRITPVGVVTEFSTGISAGAYPLSITTGPDGNLWFTENWPGMIAQIGRITPVGVVTEFSAGITVWGPTGITTGPDGNLWFTEYNGNQIGRITPAGVVTEFSAGISPGAGPQAITTGPDGNLWFTEFSGNRIGRITPAGIITEFSVGITAGAAPTGITTGPDGNLWFTEYNGNRIGRITPAGIITEFSAGISAGAAPYGITTGPDGNLWFTEYNGNRIGRITPP